MSTTRKTPEFLNGVPELLLLKLLAGRPMYGYELVQAIRVATDEALSFGEGSVYPVLHKLEADGALTSRREPVAGRNRVVYRITRAGHKRLADSTATWNQISSAVRAVLQGGQYGPAMA